MISITGPNGFISRRLALEFRRLGITTNSISLREFTIAQSFSTPPSSLVSQLAQLLRGTKTLYHLSAIVHTQHTSSSSIFESFYFNTLVSFLLQQAADT